MCVVVFFNALKHLCCVMLILACGWSAEIARGVRVRGAWYIARRDVRGGVTVRQTEWVLKCKCPSGVARLFSSVR